MARAERNYIVTKGRGGVRLITNLKTPDDVFAWAKDSIHRDLWVEVLDTYETEHFICDVVIHREEIEGLSWEILPQTSWVEGSITMKFAEEDLADWNG